MCVDLCLDLQFYSTHQYVCFMPIAQCIYYQNSVVQIEIEDGDICNSFLITQNCFSFLFCVCFHRKLKIVLSKSVKIVLAFFWGLQ